MNHQWNRRDVLKGLVVASTAALARPGLSACREGENTAAQPIEVQITPVSRHTCRLSILPVVDNGSVGSTPFDGSLIQESWGAPIAKLRAEPGHTIVVGSIKLEVSLHPVRVTATNERGDDSALTEASAAAPYIQEGDAGPAIAHLERAVNLDPLNLAAASTLIDLYQKEGKLTEAAGLAAKMQVAMREGSGADQATQPDSKSDSQRRAEEVFKNIQVLKGVPSDQVIPAMQFMTAALGVDCSFCHVVGHFEEDAKKPKQTARSMMQMMFALNRNSFDGHREVTCYSCHRGARIPAETPKLDGQSEVDAGAAGLAGPTLPSGLPTASQLIENYIKALGGAAAIAKTTSRAEKGVANCSGQSTRVELFTQAPEQLALVRHLTEGDSVVAFDGHAGWIGLPSRPVRDLHGTDVETAREVADQQFPLHLAKTFPELRVEYPEKIGGREVNVLYGIRQGQPPAKLYFEAQSGLL